MDQCAGPHGEQTYIIYFSQSTNILEIAHTSGVIYIVQTTVGSTVDRYTIIALHAAL